MAVVGVGVVGRCDCTGHVSGWLRLPLRMWPLGMMVRHWEWRDVLGMVLAGYGSGMALGMVDPAQACE